MTFYRSQSRSKTVCRRLMISTKKHRQTSGLKPTLLNYPLFFYLFFPSIASSFSVHWNSQGLISTQPLSNFKSFMPSGGHITSISGKFHTNDGSTIQSQKIGNQQRPTLLTLPPTNCLFKKKDFFKIELILSYTFQIKLSLADHPQQPFFFKHMQ